MRANAIKRERSRSPERNPPATRFEWPQLNRHGRIETADPQRPRVAKLDKEAYLELLLQKPYVTQVQCERPGGQCRSTNVRSTERQTRSSDEPVSIFHTCQVCGYTWMDGG